METSINERLKEVIEFKKINPPNIYNKIGANRSVWSGWINSNRPIPLDKVIKIVRLIPDLNARWLLTGEGEMNIPEPGVALEPAVTYKAKTDYCPICAQKDKLIDALNDHIDSLKNQLADVKKEIKPQSGAQYRKAANE